MAASSLRTSFSCYNSPHFVFFLGAFEITFNDVPVWSKLETGRIPQPPELFSIIDSHMQFQEKTIQFQEPGIQMSLKKWTTEIKTFRWKFCQEKA